MENFNLEKHWDLFLNRKVTVSCQTEKLANEFLSCCDRQKLVWAGGEILLETWWGTYQENTCYYCINNWITYGSSIIGKDLLIVKFLGFNNGEVKEKNTKIKEDIIDEGYVIFNKVAQQYCDNDQCETNDFTQIELYVDEQEAKDDLEYCDNPDNFTIRQVKIKIGSC